mmetsp:Transcript_34129/g.59555  ORF Transcript_34129/g.59555 Transcript_34129/m.59555 type:complete len:215 (+) Transcript_34129:3114-3758(+)
MKHRPSFVLWSGFAVPRCVFLRNASALCDVKVLFDFQLIKVFLQLSLLSGQQAKLQGDCHRQFVIVFLLKLLLLLFDGLLLGLQDGQLVLNLPDLPAIFPILLESSALSHHCDATQPIGVVVELHLDLLALLLLNSPKRPYQSQSASLGSALDVFDSFLLLHHEVLHPLQLLLQVESLRLSERELSVLFVEDSLELSIIFLQFCQFCGQGIHDA